MMQSDRTGSDETVFITDDSRRIPIRYYSHQIELAIACDRRIVQAIGDTGCLAIVVALLSQTMPDNRTTTLSAIEAAIVPQRIATARRARALVGWLDQSGAVERVADLSNPKWRPLRPAGWLPHVLDAIAGAVVGAAGSIPAQPSADATRALVALLVPFVRSGAILPPEIAPWADRRGGYPLLLRLIGEARCDATGAIAVELSRKAVARAYGVSRAHVILLLASGERRGWLTRLAGGAIRIDPDFDATCLAFFDRQLAGVRRAIGHAA